MLRGGASTCTFQMGVANAKNPTCQGKPGEGRGQLSDQAIDRMLQALMGCGVGTGWAGYKNGELILRVTIHQDC